jgi:hypothetical protein
MKGTNVWLAAISAGAHLLIIVPDGKDMSLPWSKILSKGRYGPLQSDCYVCSTYPYPFLVHLGLILETSQFAYMCVIGQEILVSAMHSFKCGCKPVILF